MNKDKLNLMACGHFLIKNFEINPPPPPFKNKIDSTGISFVVWTKYYLNATTESLRSTNISQLRIMSNEITASK